MLKKFGENLGQSPGQSLLIQNQMSTCQLAISAWHFRVNSGWR